jgi:hypothetical protein
VATAHAKSLWVKAVTIAIPLMVTVAAVLAQWRAGLIFDVLEER